MPGPGAEATCTAQVAGAGAGPLLGLARGRGGLQRRRWPGLAIVVRGSDSPSSSTGRGHAIASPAVPSLGLLWAHHVMVQIWIEERDGGIFAFRVLSLAKWIPCLCLRVLLVRVFDMQNTVPAAFCVWVVCCDCCWSQSKGQTLLILRFQDQHFFRGMDEISIDFSEFWYLYHQDALEKSLISAWVL